jgi:hypothetical protein
MVNFVAELLERVAVPVFVDEVFCGLLADGSEPLWAEGGHPDDVACGDGIPLVAEAVDAAAFEHKEAVLHDVDFDHAECGSGLVGHGVDGEVEGGVVGKEVANLEVGVAA